MLVVYSLGLGIPFFLSAVAVNLFFDFFQAFRKHIGFVHKVAGILLIGVGLLLITNTMVVLNSYALSLTPGWLLERL